MCLPAWCITAKNINQPPILKDEPVAEQQYLKTIADNFNNFEVVTIDPNGNRTGRYGDVVIYNNSGTYRFRVCTSSPTGTVWAALS